MAWCIRRSTWKSPTRSATWTTSRMSPAAWILSTRYPIASRSGVRIRRCCCGESKAASPPPAHQSRQSRFQSPRMKTEWAGTAFVRHTTVAVDGIQPVGPAGVRLLCRVPEIVHQRRDRDMQVAYARVRHGHALLGAARARDYDVLLHVRCHLPHIARVRFLNVHDVESGAILIPFVELVERGNLPAKGRSSIAAEDQQH